MNKSRIEWCDHTLNIITGCRHGCPYCYARTMTNRFSGDARRNLMQNRHVTVQNGCYELDEPFLDENGKQIVYPFGFEPTFHKYRLNILDKYKSGKNFFVGAMADIFGDWVPDAWLTDVFDVCTQHKLNNYLFLTKNPARYKTLLLPAGNNFWYGTTITKNADVKRIEQLPFHRNKFLSIEPLLENIIFAPEDFWGIDWIILGAETGHRKEKVVPEFSWVKRIVLWADTQGVPVFMKESMVPIVGEKNMRRDYPGQLLHKPISVKREGILYTHCVECGETFKRNTMVSLTAKVGRHDSKNRAPARTIATMCRKCYTSWCKYHKLESHVEELYGDKEEKTDEETKLPENEG